MSNPIEINDVLALLPHRYPFLLIDRVEDYKAFDFLTARKNVTINEPFFTGHFPGNPVMPGVLILEALAQTSVVLSNLSIETELLHFFASINNVKFKHIVRPGDSLRLHVILIGQKKRGEKSFWRMHGEAFVDDKLACSADFMSAAEEMES